MSAHEFELAELPDGVSVVSVVSRADTAGAEPTHVFQVRRGDEIIAELDSVREVANLLRELRGDAPD